MLDEKTLEEIKENRYLRGKDFSTELHRIIHEFYENFDLDRQDNSYREIYIRNFIEDHEPFIVNYVTNIYNSNLRVTDKLSDELTFNKFLDTLVSYLIKFQEEEERSENDY